jgi:putative metallopeptidase
MAIEKLDQEIVDSIEKIMLNFNLPVTMRYYYQENAKLKRLIKIAKIPDHYAVAISSDILVHVNESYFNALDEESRQILIEQELDKIEFNLDKGSFKINATGRINTSSGIINKYTYDNVYRAIQSEVEFAQQSADKD